jgi:hypothetical protein
MRWKKWLIGIVIVVVAIQFVPYGHTHTNPPVVAEPQWNSPQTRALFHRACFDCHSNETVWPWYSHVAPVSWLVTRDVNDGRRHVNFSEWNRPQRDARNVQREVTGGDMPLWFYLPMHPTARLTPAEKQQLLSGVVPTFGPQRAPGQGR